MTLVCCFVEGDLDRAAPTATESVPLVPVEGK